VIGWDKLPNTPTTVLLQYLSSASRNMTNVQSHSCKDYRTSAPLLLQSQAHSSSQQYRIAT
jgi:hypothetical protein